jgi:hypothetical protein
MELLDVLVVNGFFVKVRKPAANRTCSASSLPFKAVVNENLHRKVCSADVVAVIDYVAVSTLRTNAEFTVRGFG